MGAAQQVEIFGAKGGSDKPKTPTEAPDSLRSVAMAKVLIAMGEGEFAGNPTAQDIFLDNTPLQDPQGNMNFPNVKWEFRSGSVEQSYIQGIPSIENETSLGIELRSGTSWVRAISNTELSAARLRFAWPALQSVDASGNVNGYRIEYKVELSTDGGAYQQVLSEAVDGKTTGTYERTRRIDLPSAASGWLMRVTRITPNQNNNKIADTMQIAGFTEVIDAKLRYPNTALLYIEFSAEQFRGIPAVTVDCQARKWMVPSNYNPDARSYTGIWNGTFKEAWTDNPAWITYGITVNDRFGLGRRIKPWQVDKWELYRIAQYCDQLVPNGKGGQEPRFICNLNLQGKADAWSLLRDISAIYRGMTYWAQGQIFSLSDMPRATDFDFAYTRANVIDGKFTYSSASERTRYSRALISYDNPANNYDTDVTAVTDPKLQRRYGDNPLEISAIGCTRESEAQRRGKWALLTNSKDRGISFKVGLDGRIPLPGYVIPVADELLAGRAIGGRISAVAGRAITLDRDTQAKTGDRLILNLPNGKCEGRTVQSVAGRVVTVTVAYSAVPERELVWALDADDLAVPLYRVTSVSRPEPGVFEISAIQYDPSKFAHIDTGARLEERPISVIPITVVPAPASVTVTSNSVVSQGIAVATMTINWPAVNGAVGYDVEWRKDSGNWIKLPRTGATGVDVIGIYAGAYLARVRAVSSFDISSIWRSSTLTSLTGKQGLPPAVSFLTATPLLFGIGLKWGFPAAAEDTQRTELWYGPTTNLEAATKLADLAYPQSDYSMQSLQAGARFFFWARLIDRTGNVGPWYPTGLGVMGQASADAGPILDQIAGEISETELGSGLLGRIDLIDGPPALPGSVNSRLKELDEQISEVTDQLQEQITQVGTIAKSGEYQKEKAYAVGASVRLNDRLYQSKIAVPADATGAKSPPNATYWLDVGQVVSDSNGLAARVSTTETKITNIEGVNTAQGTSITGLQTSLTTTNGNVTAAQTAANAASTLAGGKGKVLVQTATPAAADQLVQNLWIDITGGANTPKRWSGSAWAAVTDKIATDAAAAAANALAVANTKADSSAVSILTSRVTSAEDTITSQGTAITGLNNSLTTTNGNVTAAQNAANAANTLAGGKGKVIVQTAAPAAADQLAQNLWIDTTNNANTPKRWTGSAWVAVTDKAATDAAGAAASALAQVATKAEAATVTALSNTVTQQGTAITAQGTALTNIQATVGAITPDNLVADPTFSNGVTAVTNLTTRFTNVPKTDPGAPSGSSSPRLLKYTGPVDTGNTYIRLRTIDSLQSPETTDVGRVTAAPGDIFEFSLDVFVPLGAPRQIGLWAQPYNSAYADLGGRFPLPTTTSITTATDQWVTISGSVTCPADTVMIGMAFRIYSGPAGVLWFANPRMSKRTAAQAATASAVTSLDARVTQTETGLTSQATQITSLTTSVAGKADNSALQSLASTVTQQGTTLTSQGTAVTQLQSTVGAIGGSGLNLVPDTYSWLSSTAPPPTNVNTATVLAVAVSDAISGFGYKFTSTSSSTGSYVMLSPSNNVAGFNIPIEAASYLVSFYASCPTIATLRIRIYSSGTPSISVYSSTISLTATRTRYTLRVTSAVATTAALIFYENMSGVAATEVTVDSVMMEKQVGTNTSPSPFVAGSSASTASGQATAIGSLDVRVTDTEGQITAQATKLDGIYVQVNPMLAGDTAGYAGSTGSFVGVWSEQSARIEDGMVIGRKVDTVEVSANQAVDLAQQNNSAVQQVSAVVQQVSQAQITADGKASAMWAVKLQVNAQGQYVAAGVGLGIENGPAGLQSSFLVSADTFAVVNGINGTLSSPFAVTGGQVFIRSAFIQDLSLSFGKIADNIQSDNYVANSTGWKLSKSGGMELNSTVAGQGRVQVTNRAVKVWDANGILRVQLGDLAA